MIIRSSQLTEIDAIQDAIWSCRGDLEILEGGCISILGERGPSTVTIRRTRKLVRAVREIGWGVAARLSPGVPLEAMRAAIEVRAKVMGIAGEAAHEPRDFGELLGREHLLLRQVRTPCTRTPCIARMMAAVTHASIFVTDAVEARRHYEACKAFGRPVAVLASLAKRPPDWLELECAHVIHDFDDLVAVLCSLPMPEIRFVVGSHIRGA